MTITYIHSWRKCWISVQFSSVQSLSLTLCDPMNRSMPGHPVYHQLPEFTQTHVHEFQLEGSQNKDVSFFHNLMHGYPEFYSKAFGVYEPSLNTPHPNREWRLRALTVPVTCPIAVDAQALRLVLCINHGSVKKQTLWNPMGCSPPGSSVHGILQAKILEWVAMPFSRGPSQPKGRTQVSPIAGRFLTESPGKPEETESTEKIERETLI